MSKLDKIIFDSRNANKEIKPDLKASAEQRWLSKHVQDNCVIHDCNTMEGIELKGFGELEITNQKSHSGSKCVVLTTNTDIEGVEPRPVSRVDITPKKQNWTNYNRVSLWIYPESRGHQNFYFHISINNQGQKGLLHAPSLTPNQWNHVVWEIPDYNRNHITKLSINPFLMGCPPEAEPIIKIYIDDIQIQKVDPDYIEGWDLQDRIAYCHSGYFVDAKKIALTQIASSDSFIVRNNEDKIVYVGNIDKVKTDLGMFYQLDFSDINHTGEFYIQIDDRKTSKFIIDENPYKTSIWKSLNFLRMLRCGYDVPEVHSPCHLNHYSLHPDGRIVPNHGGWHDAGDVSQFEICTAEMAHAILDMGEKLLKTDQPLAERLLEEARWGINWLLRTRFGDGYRSLGVTYRIWRKNVIDTKLFSPENQVFARNAAENGPFENFCAAAAEAAAARVFKHEDQIFADWCLRAAIEDFWFAVDGYDQGLYTKRWGPGPIAQVCGEGALAAAELYRVTKDEKILEQGCEYARIVLSCQQSETPKWKRPLRGFFYEDPDHTKILVYEHRGHEQTPVQGLARLCEVASHHSDYRKWKQGLELYAEYITATAMDINPYQLLPAHVYQYDKLDFTRFTIPKGWGTPEEIQTEFKDQIEQGIPLDKDIYLRRFPIAIQRRGYHATLLSKVKGITEVAKVLGKNELMQIAIDQLEWILGKNPFSSSTMYGEGNNYHPLYVAFSRQMVGSLPVGIKTRGANDAPYWPTVNNAVYKEIWGHTTGKYLWVLADLI